jgi:hypothetical protein
MSTNFANLLTNNFQKKTPCVNLLSVVVTTRLSLEGKEFGIRKSILGHQKMKHVEGKQMNGYSELL